MALTTSPKVKLVLLFVGILSVFQKCGAFVPTVSSLFGARLAAAPPATTTTGLHASTRNSPGMVLAGLPTPKKAKADAPAEEAQPSGNQSKRPWEEDFPTTLGKAAFSRFKDTARDMMVKGAEKRGLDWTGIVETLKVPCLQESSKSYHMAGFKRRIKRGGLWRCTVHILSFCRML